MSDEPEVTTLHAQQLPLPPKEISFQNHVERQWEKIIRFWKNGWADESSLSNLESLIEFERAKLFDRNEPDPRPFDWKSDWIEAKMIHDFNVDVVKNRKQHVDDVKKMWFEWTERSFTYFSDVSLEALKSMVLIDGAAIIAALTVLSGQIAQPWPAAVLVSKLTVFTSVTSLLMMGAGHSVLFLRMSDLVSQVRSILIGNTKHHKLYAIPRYLKRYADPATKLANTLIFGSIAVFGISAFLSALILLFAPGPSALP
ncbi:hypothetical protein EJ069_10360 [Mesorhizobium sp. M2A.F.Ca.ET.043.05.1.1]|uniref:hypothetical protein n=1 Tax=Mesorhizobium sp. M2A.F.Ca.ET.043.05.1.1 TaxID=2493671 RepID=UPI000F753F4A|nr:hypothetical protein [Mesorhizobium sp. M2A.F.Ca.ET.043.05.1.1]AZO15097.1 hypothetical protein EJ069_10360 [Mesorhizobium sp. M2A.F.Ca.ET.043.05.1.1]